MRTALSMQILAHKNIETVLSVGVRKYLLFTSTFYRANVCLFIFLYSGEGLVIWRSLRIRDHWIMAENC